jgi:hypothetical protein
MAGVIWPIPPGNPACTRSTDAVHGRASRVGISFVLVAKTFCLAESGEAMKTMIALIGCLLWALRGRVPSTPTVRLAPNA